MANVYFEPNLFQDNRDVVIATSLAFQYSAFHCDTLQQDLSLEPKTKTLILQFAFQMDDDTLGDNVTLLETILQENQVIFRQIIVLKCHCFPYLR